MLTENVPLSLTHWKIGHLSDMDDLPIGNFIIADSLKKKLMGPFKAVGKQYHKDNPIRFYRYPPGPILRDCHWLLNFEPHPLFSGKGIDWPLAAELISAPTSLWQNIRQFRPTPEQLDLLFHALIDINLGQDLADGVFLIDEFYHDQFMTDEDRQYAQDAYESSEEGIIDILFNGEREIYENWCESTDF